MEAENVHVLIDACIEGGRLRQLFPPLEDGLTPRDIRVLEQLHRLSQTREQVQVSDISEMLEVTRPGITASLKVLTTKGYVEKQRDREDGRVVYVRLTEKGAETVQRTVTDFHRRLSETVFAEISDEEALRTAEVIHRAVEAMRSYEG